MMKSPRGLLFVILCLLIIPGVVSANTTSVWSQAGIERFYKGKFVGTALMDDGRVSLGFKIDEAATSTEPYFWSLAYDNNGVLWAGTGNKAILYQMEKGKTREAAVLPGTGITSLAVDSKNNIYAAVMPGGMIYMIDGTGKRSDFVTVPATYIWDMKFDNKDNLYCVTGMGAGVYKISPDKKILPLYLSSESHLLSMFLDGKGNLYTSSSPNGLILKINLKEAEKLSGASSRFPFMLPPNKWGGRLSGSEKGPTAGNGDGGDLNIEENGEKTPSEPDAKETDKNKDATPADTFAVPDPRVTVLLDLEEDEAYRLLPLPDGDFIVAANRAQPNTQQQQQQGPPRPPSMRPEPLSFPLGQTSPFTPPNKIDIPARLYLVSPDGNRRLLLEIPDPYILSMQYLGNNEVLVGTGNDGRIYTFNIDTSTALLQELPVKQVLAMVGQGDKLRLASGNPGGIYAPTKSRMDKGDFISSVNDAQTLARYGNLDAVASVPDKASVAFSTRSGNTPDPTDGTWSAWSKPREKWPFLITSPAGRYIQYTATLKSAPDGQTPILREVRTYYLNENQAPEIDQLQVLPQPDQRAASPAQQGGGAPGRPPQQPGPQQSQAQGPKGLPQPPSQEPAEKNLVVGTVRVSSEITFRWIASDPDSDTLKFRLDFRKIPSQTWIKLEDKIYGSEYRWQTDSIPDGTYEAQLTATDEDSNTPDRALTYEFTSDPFIIDHSRPEIKIGSVTKTKDGGFEVKLEASDPTSIISEAEYSLNDLEWKMAFPDDSIYDSLNEKITIKIGKTDASKSDSNTLLIRVRDFVGNTGSASVQLDNTTGK